MSPVGKKRRRRERRGEKSKRKISTDLVMITSISTYISCIVLQAETGVTNAAVLGCQVALIMWVFSELPGDV